MRMIPRDFERVAPFVVERGEREGLGGRGLSGIFNILFIKQNKNLLKQIVAASVIKC